MRTFIRVALIAATLSLVGCTGGVDVATKVQAGIAKTCDFLADIKWVRDIVAKMDITAATINQAVTMVCDGLVKTEAMSLLSEQKPKCPNGSIVVKGETICIEGDFIEPPKDEK